MARSTRQNSESGYLHIIVRGNGKQILFEDTQDFRHFLNRLKRYCLQTDVRICAYCLMDNHVHLLARGDSSSMVLLMRKLGVSYSVYYNKKYEHVGHIFQNRFMSEPVETEKYLLSVFRYILQNPEKAAICKSSEYPWSSFGSYRDPPEFMDMSLIKSLLGDEAHYRDFILSEDCRQYMDYDNTGHKNIRHDDSWAINEIGQCLGIPSGTIIQNYSKADRNAALRKLKEHGLSIRQIERLTGISRNIIQRS